MKSCRVRRVLTILIGIALVAVAHAAVEVGAGEVTTLTGDVEEAAYDDDGNVTAVSIYDSEWGSVLVSDQGRGKSLLGLVGAVVKATGTVEEADGESGFAYVIHVTEFSIEQPAETEEDVDWDSEPETEY